MDSLSVLKSLKQFPGCTYPLFFNILDILEELTSWVFATFIHSHFGIADYKLADKTAKLAYISINFTIHAND